MSAVLVMASHAWHFGGQLEQEPLHVLTRKLYTMGTLGSGTLFIVSGFLGAASVERLGWRTFAQRRLLRVWPAYCVQVALVVIVVGPAVTTLPGATWATFMRHPHTREFAWSAVVPYLSVLHTTQQRMTLPGVFVAMPLRTPNPPLWSLAYQVEAWVLLALLRAASPLHAARHLVLGVAFALCAVAQGGAAGGGGNGEAWLLAQFFAGAAAFLFRSSVCLDRRLLLALCPCGLVALAFGTGAEALGVEGMDASKAAHVAVAAARAATPQMLRVFCVPFHVYTVLYVGLCCPAPPRWARRLERCSYGVYLYGGLVQQLLLWVWGHEQQRPLLNLAVSLPLALVLAQVSHRVVDEPVRRAIQQRAEKTQQSRT